MTHREKLLEQYEDAVFSLLINEVVEQEGQVLLAEAERLNNDPDAAIPEELDRKCQKIIQSSFRKRQRKPARRVTVKVLQKVAVAVLAAALLLGAAYAAIPEFRVGVLNLVLTVTDTSTGLKLVPGSSKAIEPVLDSAIYCYGVPQVPEGYELRPDYSAEEIDERFYWYVNENDDIIQIEILQGSTGTNMGIDTEDAQAVTNIIVNGYEGLCVEKNGRVQVAWVDTDRQVFMFIYCTALDKETVLEMAQAMKYMQPGT